MKPLVLRKVGGWPLKARLDLEPCVEGTMQPDHRERVGVGLHAPAGRKLTASGQWVQWEVQCEAQNTRGRGCWEVDLFSRKVVLPEKPQGLQGSEKMETVRGAWMIQSVKRLTSAGVVISRLWVQAPHPALWFRACLGFSLSLSLSLSLSPVSLCPLPIELSVSLKINKLLKKWKLAVGCPILQKGVLDRQADCQWNFTGHVLCT